MLDIDDLYWELKYAEVGESYEVLLRMPYDTLSHIHKRTMVQKKWEAEKSGKLSRK